MRRWLFALFCAASPLFAQNSTPPVLHMGTQLVVVDVNVTNSHGEPVHHLKRSDFQVTEDGTTQNATFFEEHTTPSAAESAKSPAMPKLPPNVFTDVTVAPQDSPVNVLIFDTLNTPIDKQAEARKQVLEYLKSMKAGTQLAIFVLTTHMELLQGLTTDSRLLVSAVSNTNVVQSSAILPDSVATETLSQMVHPPSKEITAVNAQTESNQFAQQNTDRVIYTLSSMNQLARYLSGFSGRKNVIWFSGSFPLNFAPDLGVSDPLMNTTSFQSAFRETMNLFARNQIALYPVDARGLMGTPLSDATSTKYSYHGGSVLGDTAKFTGNTRGEHDTMQQMAKATGGKAYFDTNGLGQAMGSILQNEGDYYTFAYSPTNKSSDGTFRSINVHLASGNYVLTYRDGYYANTTEAAKTQANEKPADVPALKHLDPVRNAMQRGAPSPSEIIFKAMVVQSSTSATKPPEGNVAAKNAKPPYRVVTVAYAANPSDITMPAGPDGSRQVGLEFVALVYNRSGELMVQQSNAVNVFAKPAAQQDFAKGGVQYQQQVAVPAKGDYYLRLGIHDMIGNKLGVVEIPTNSIREAQDQPGK